MLFHGINKYKGRAVVFPAIGFSLALSLILGACGIRAPHLNPLVTSTEPVSAENTVTVEIRPVDTSGFGNTDRKRLGIDLSAYFTAVEVKIGNRTSLTVKVDSRKASLTDHSGLSYPALSIEESLNVFELNDFRRGRNVQFPQSDEKALQMAERIRDLHLKSGEIPDGGSLEGVVFFRKISEDQCDSVSLVLDGIWISGEDSERKFQFSLSCPGE